MAAGLLYGVTLREQNKKIIQFELVFEIDLRPHLIGYRTIDPKMKNAIREEVTKQLTELWREYYEIRSERREVGRKSPREFGGTAKQLRKLRELNSVMVKKWGLYIKARKLAEWWEISIDPPELPGRLGRLFYFIK